jgi:hypothetical protein
MIFDFAYVHGLTKAPPDLPRTKAHHTLKRENSLPQPHTDDNDVYQQPPPTTTVPTLHWALHAPCTVKSRKRTLESTTGTTASSSNPVSDEHQRAKRRCSHNESIDNESGGGIAWLFEEQ